MSHDDYFRAHASDAKSWVRQLHQCLTRMALDVFFDELSLDPGDDWTLAIPDALAASAATVACISPRFVLAHYFRAEVVRAVQRKRDPAAAHRLIPVYLDGFGNGGGAAPYGLEPLHGLDAVVPGIDDPVAIRFQYERRFRQAWDRGETTSLADVGKAGRTSAVQTVVVCRVQIETTTTVTGLPGAPVRGGPAP